MIQRIFQGEKFEKRIEEIKKVNAGIEQKHFMNK